MIATVDNFFDLYIEAGNPGTCPERLAELAASSDYRIRLRVAENANTPVETLSVLMKDCVPDVLIALSSNGNLPAPFLLELACDFDPAIRMGIAQELSSPRSVLGVLAVDENPFVRHEALKTLEALGHYSVAGVLQCGVHHMDKFTMKKLRGRKTKRRIRRA